MSAAASTAATPAQILHHTSQFVSKTFSQSELRHGLFSAFRHKSPKSGHVTLKQLNLAAETLENAISATNPAVRSSSLRLAAKLLRPYPQHPFSLLLQSLIHALSLHPLESSIALLDMFGSDPSISRSEIAPSLFEELFLVHLLPVLRWFNDQRSRILSSLLTDSGNNGDDQSLSGTKSLSRMSGNQTSELKQLESAYEEAIDENCQVLVKYFKEVLVSKIGDGPISPPYLIPKKIGEDEQLECSDDDDDQIGTEELGNGRYNNPMWAAEGEGSVEFYRSKSKSPPSYPQRVSLSILTDHESLSRLKASPNIDSASEAELSQEDTSANSSSESEAEPEVKNRKMSLFHPSPGETSRSPDRLMANFDNPPGGGKNTPPKDFVCPITSNVFTDPVTLETGQTYERKAIQEWIDRGNSSCPITRQMLHSTQLPKTNYVLKRLIASWQECNPEPVLSPSEPDPDPDPVAKSIMPATSPNSVISQANIDGMLGELRHAITNLCMSEILLESETAVLRIEQFWWEGHEELDIQSMLSKPAVINGFVEILFNSVDPRVLKATIFLLSELGSRERVVIQTLTQVDSDVECIVALFKNGLLEASVLIHLLRPSTISLVEMDMVESLFYVIKKREEDLLKMSMKPKTAAILLLGQILGSSEESMVSSIARAVVSAKVVENVIGSLGSEMSEERIAAVGILLRCMVEDGMCRNIIADKAELAPVLESFMSARDDQRFQIVQFLSELVKLNKRTFNEQILHIIKDEGAFSTMHSLLIYLQAALPYQCPVVAGLLLQLDLLVEPRKMSIYREEAIDTLIACLRNSEYPAAQIAAAETIVSLHGRFSASGEPLARAFLLKRAGLEKNYKAFMRMEKPRNGSGDFEDVMEEEKAAEDWERRVAFALVSHEFGLLFEALAEGLKSRYAELCSACFVSATWLVHMLTVLPDTGIRGAARLCLLKRFISIFKSAKDTEDRALSVLAMRSFMQDPEGMRDLTLYMKDILKGLRDLKKSSHLAFEMLKLFSEGNDSSADMWSHKELIQVDCSENGEVLSIVCFRDKIFSGHTDGTIKVWTGRGSILHLLQETREHTKAVTSLAILQSGDKLYSGSLDKTTRVWSISNSVISCVQVHDMKDQVHSLVVSNSISCFIPQGAGVKVHSWNGGSKLVNSSKHVKALALVHGKLYCGCHDSSIQEVDLATGTLGTIQSGSRKLLAKSNPVHALQAHNGLIYSATSPLDGAAVKIWSASNYGMVGSLACTQEVRAMAISSDLIYLGCKGGAIEIWCREKQSKVDTLQTGTNAKILAMALDASEEILVTGTSDGRIQAWGLS